MPSAELSSDASPTSFIWSTKSSSESSAASAVAGEGGSPLSSAEDTLGVVAAPAAAETLPGAFLLPIRDVTSSGGL